MLPCVATNKEKLLTVKVAPQVLQDFKVAAELKGGTMSALVHMFVVQTIREQKERNPESFAPEKEKRRRVIVAEAKDEKRTDPIRKDGRRRASGGRKSG